MKNKKWTLSIIFVTFLSILSIFLLGFKLTTNKTPNQVYAIYVEGKKIGVVKSQEEFNEYINLQEEKIKEEYGVDKIYTPNGVEIKKIITYGNRFNTNEEIYKMLVKEQSFTVKGIIINIEKEISYRKFILTFFHIILRILTLSSMRNVLHIILVNMAKFLLHMHKCKYCNLG